MPHGAHPGNPPLPTQQHCRPQGQAQIDLVIGDLNAAESAVGNVAATGQQRIADTDDSGGVWQYFGRPSACSCRGDAS